MGEREAQPVAFLCLLSFGHAKESKKSISDNYFRFEHSIKLVSEFVQSSFGYAIESKNLKNSIYVLYLKHEKWHFQFNSET